MSLEAAEVLEHFQWKSDREARNHTRDNKEELGDELADVAIFLFKLADKTNVDLAKAIERKLVKASKKYPVEAVKGDSGLAKYYKIKKKARR